MAGGEGGGSEEGLPGFRADARLGDELSRHSAIREGGNAGALDEKSKRFRDLRNEAFCAEVKSRSGRGEERARESWSNGLVEGHINRLKTHKRQMYGRAGFELLRARLLPMSRGSPLHRN